MLGDRKGVVAACLAIPARDAGKAVRNVGDFHVERRRVEQVEAAARKHALPGAGRLACAHDPASSSSVGNDRPLQAGRVRSTGTSPARTVWPAARAAPTRSMRTMARPLPPLTVPSAPTGLPATVIAVPLSGSDASAPTCTRRRLAVTRDR